MSKSTTNDASFISRNLRKLVRYALLIGIAWIVVLQLWYLFWVIVFSFSNPLSTAFIRHEAVELHQQKPPKSIRYEWRDYEKISKYAKQAAIASEDSGFMSHNGLEFDALIDAWKFNLRNQGDKIRGGSTITQQLAKNLFLSSDRSYTRKIQEAVISVMIESLMSKQRILELYLNVVEFGEGIFGIESAAQHYFKTSADKLNADQAARLISLLPSPQVYGKNIYSSYINRHTRRIRSYMSQVALPKQ